MKINLWDGKTMIWITGSDPDLLGDLGSHSGPSAHPQQNCNMDLGQNKNRCFTWEEEGGKKTWNISKSQVRILSPNHVYKFDPTACTKCTKKPAPIWGQLQHWTRANPRPKSGGSTKGARSSQSRAYRFSMAIWHGFESQKRDNNWNVNIPNIFKARKWWSTPCKM